MTDRYLSTSLGFNLLYPLKRLSIPAILRLVQGDR